MRTTGTIRNFRIVIHNKYASEPEKDTRLVQESSAVGDYEDSWNKPGSSFLWIGEDHHLNREEVSELIEKLQFWLDNKRLELKQ